MTGDKSLNGVGGSLLAAAKLEFIENVAQVETSDCVFGDDEFFGDVAVGERRARFEA